MKKILSLILSIVMVFSFSTSVLAAYIPEDDIVSPCYITIDGIVCSMSENDGNIYASVSVGTMKSCSVEITMAVQRSTYGTSWANYRSYPKVTLTSGGSRSTSRTVEDVPTGFYYRTYAIVNVYVNGTLTDSDIVESDPVYVS
ncbi:MAG: hypothetical protein IKL57_01640 [Oscillospiraceae bacterium]|nr:hypothetical protein [Oscillospiraceae bacterium]